MYSASVQYQYMSWCDLVILHHMTSHMSISRKVHEPQQNMLRYILIRLHEKSTTAPYQVVPQDVRCLIYVNQPDLM